MSDRPTPKTDEQTFDQEGYRPTGSDGEILSVPVEFARQLERELAESREEIAILRSDEKRLAAFSKRDRERADDLSDQLAKVVCDWDKTCVENLEQARLLGMSAEREADLRGELEREKRRAEENGILAHNLGRQLAEARENGAAMSRIAAACQCPSKDVDIALLKGRFAATRKQRDRLAQVIDAATVLIAAKGRHNTFLAYEGLREALSAVKDSANVKGMAPGSAVPDSESTNPADR